MIKQLLTATLVIILSFQAQHEVNAQEQYGKTLNIGLGIGGHYGYSRYANQVLPVVTINYEIDVARNFTIAPFVSFYSYSNKYYWSNRDYTYRETVIPVGAKGTYYFDEFLGAGSSWDFYGGASLGFAIVNSRWEEGYDGDEKHFNNRSPLFLAIHLGAEYHFNSKLGMFLDLSSGFSTIGLSFHK